MGDEAPINGTNNAAAPNGAAKPDARAAFLAAFPDPIGEEPKAKPAAAPTPKPTEKPKAEAKPELDDDVDLPDLDGDDSDDVDLDDEDAPKVDAKGAEALKKLERRIRADADKTVRAAEDRAKAAETKHAELQGKIDDHEKQRARAKHDPIAWLKYGGFVDDDLDVVARIAYAHSPAAASDPKNKEHREAAARLARERESGEKMSTLEKRLESYEQREKDREQQTAVQRHLTDYFDGAVSAAKKYGADKLPLLARHLEKSPKGALAALQNIAKDHLDRAGELPSVKDLLRVYEKNRRAELAELGVDVPALIGSAKKSKENASNAEKDKSAKAAQRTEDGKRPSASRDRRAEFIARGESGEFD